MPLIVRWGVPVGQCYPLVIVIVTSTFPKHTQKRNHGNYLCVLEFMFIDD